MADSPVIYALVKKRAELAGVTYAQLVDKLKEIGVSETEPNVRNKLARGKFTAVFCFNAYPQLDLRPCVWTSLGCAIQRRDVRLL